MSTDNWRCEMCNESTCAWSCVARRERLNEEIEAAYWHFDALVRGDNAERKRAGLGPMDERMAFKAAIWRVISKVK